MTDPDHQRRIVGVSRRRPADEADHEPQRREKKNRAADHDMD